MARKLMLLINPNSGKGGYKAGLGDVLELFYKENYEPTVFFSQYSGHTPIIVRENARRFDLLVCTGGDGTLSETIAGLLEIPMAQRPRLGYIPLGTTNDVARTLGIPRKPVEAAAAICTGQPFMIDTGIFSGDKSFVYVAAFGAFTETSYETPQEAKAVLGHLAYMLEGARRLGNIEPIHATIAYDDGTIEGDFLFGAITNTTSVAGILKLNHSLAALGDGVFEILLIKNPANVFDFSDLISRLLSGDLNGSNIILLRSKKITVTTDKEVAWTLDGENGGSHKNVSVSINHPGTEIIVPHLIVG
ncbi:MAG: YegS/Rv2252/BmrU family lipid kinase [Oscillospiraceae bacterium]|nr:YegS/Rv2252/BmrU family lipid kinase [Oscillospiraceae bacterium]